LKALGSSGGAGSTRVESAWFQRLKLQHDEPLSIFAGVVQLQPGLKALGFGLSVLENN